jgi:hypothetical protein
MTASDRRSLGDIQCLPVYKSAADVACDTWADNVGCAPCVMLVYVHCRAQKLLRKVSGGSKCIPLAGCHICLCMTHAAAGHIYVSVTVDHLIRSFLNPSRIARERCNSGLQTPTTPTSQ